MKINEVIAEALNTGTGTPNPDVPKPAPKRTGGKVAGQTSMTPNAIRKREQRERDRLAKQTTGGGGAFNQMANTATAPTKPPAEEPTDPGANAFGQMANTLSDPATTTPATQDNRDPALDGITDEELAKVAAKWDDAKLARANSLGTLDPRVKAVVAAEIAKRSNAKTTQALNPTQTTNPSTPNTSPAQNTQPAQPKQSLWQRLKKGFTNPGGSAPVGNDKDNIANAALPIWRKFLQQYLAGYGDGPENISAAAKAFAEKNYPQAGKAEIESGVKNVNDAKTADAYILKLANRALANY